MSKKTDTVLMNTPFLGGDNIREVYFIGIGGIGMSAVARFFHSKGVKVSGYDKTPTTLTKELEKMGISIHYEENIDKIPADAQLVVYTPAIPKDHRELVYYQQRGSKVVKRSDVLQMISESSFNICVAGTHGKTTITTMVAHLLRDTGYGCNAFLGGISVNYGTNFWSDPKNVCVIEADEYDRSFLKLSPDIAVISAMDPDHLDIYGTAESVEQAFIDFSKKIKPGGLLFSKYGLKKERELTADRHLSYSRSDNRADIYASNIRIENYRYVFDVRIKEDLLLDVVLNMGGMHNIENAVAAIGVASSLGIESEKIKKAVESFRGVKRRFEYIIAPAENVMIGGNKGIIVIDDYAHHPQELKALIHGVKTFFSGSKCVIIFQPHLYSRTKDFAKEFAESLDMADEVIILPIYPARELPIEGVNSGLIAQYMKNENKLLLDKNELLEWVKSLKKTKQQYTHGAKILITAGAGDIDTLIEPIKKILKEV